jgi:hypothetical protein
LPTPLAELVTDLTTDYGDDILASVVAERALIRALAFLNADLQQGYEVAGDPKEINPEILGFHRELLLLRALAYLVRIKRNATNASVSFKSGDKSVTRTSSTWMELERDLLKEYWRLIRMNNPNAVEGVMVPTETPEIYRRGSETE